MMEEAMKEAMNDKTALKPCPFTIAKGIAHNPRTRSQWNMHWVECGCGARGPSVYVVHPGKEPTDAERDTWITQIESATADAWNARHVPELSAEDEHAATVAWFCMTKTFDEFLGLLREYGLAIVRVKP